MQKETNNSIDIFTIHEAIMNDYKSFVNSVININNTKIKETVENAIKVGKF